MIYVLRPISDPFVGTRLYAEKPDGDGVEALDILSQGVVVTATSERDARAVANKLSMNAKGAAWLDPAKVSCLKVDETKPGQIVLHAYLAMQSNGDIVGMPDKPATL